METNSKNDIIVCGDHEIAIQWILPKTAQLNQPTLVFLHDALGSIAQWRGFPELVVAATGCPGLVYDRFGYGNSTPRTQPRSSQYMHDEALIALPLLLQKLKIEDVILIGHSDGASIALMFAGQCPPGIKIRSVISEAAHVFVEEITLKGIQDVVDATQSNSFLKKLALFHGDKTDTVFRGWHETWLSTEFRNWNIENFLTNIKCPNLIIQGLDDEYGTLAQVESIVTKTKGTSEKLLIPKCGHVPHLQAKELVLEKMALFIESITQ